MKIENITVPIAFFTKAQAKGAYDKILMGSSGRAVKVSLA